MVAIDKIQFLERLEARVENHLQEAISVFQNASLESLLKPAADGGWSIAQCLEHLNRYGHYYLPEIKDGLAKHTGKPASENFKSTWLGSYFTRMMEPETGKKKSKAFKDYNPSPNLDAHAVVAEFIQQQEELIRLLKKAHDADLNQVKIPLSILKWFTLRLGDVFGFLIAHNHRHMLQAKRNLA